MSPPPPPLDENIGPANSPDTITSQTGTVFEKPQGQYIPPPTPSKLSDTSQVTGHINQLFDELRSNYEQNAARFHEQTRKALQQLEDMEHQLKTLLQQLEDDRDVVTDTERRDSQAEPGSQDDNVFEAASPNA